MTRIGTSRNEGILMFLPRRDDDAVHQDQTDGNAICLFGNIIH